jgi:cation diffusion facilitator CzcD-associated flavoprotein CzcO
VSSTREQHLLRLRAQVERELSLLSYPARDWVAKKHTRDGAPIYDVLIVGAGQGGLAVAFGLLRERVQNILVVDQNPLDRAGPWLSFARMPTLRTPKYLTGPDLGVPSLTPRAYYEAQFGEGSWEALSYLPRTLWAEYLAWYRETLALPVRADTRVGALSWEAVESAFRVPCVRAGASETLWARRVVLATGIEGSGAWQVPDAVKDHLPDTLYAHSARAIDFADLRGKSVAVLGAGASAFDNAATALEHGAREARMFFRRAQLVDVNAYRWAEFVGFLKHFGDLADAQKWRFVHQILCMGQLPPRDTFERAKALPGFTLTPDTRTLAFEAVREGERERVRIHTNHGDYHADFLIVGTGFVTDLRLRPELVRFESEIARWAERYQPEPSEAHEDLARHPYLGPHFEFCERHPGGAPYLANLFNFTFGGLLSLGFGGASISGMKYAVARLVFGITRSLFLEDADFYYDSLRSFAEKEL